MVLEPQLRLATDVFLCEDGHAQERTLLASVLTSVQPNDLWIADRNMCTLGFVFGLQQRQAAFVIPQHGGLPYQALDQLHLVATSETGEVFEQRIELVREDQRIQQRPIVVKLNQPTRDGDTEIAILTCVPAAVVLAIEVAQLYRHRWTIEEFFQSVTLNARRRNSNPCLSQSSLVFLLHGIGCRQHSGSGTGNTCQCAWRGQN